jgi:hypothetical protein
MLKLLSTELLNLRKLRKFAVELSTNVIIQNSVNKELLGQLK